MKIFLDTADIPVIKQWLPTGIIDGITTNPGILAREQKNTTAIVKEICKLVDPLPVSVEVTESDPAKLLKQAHAIAKIAPNVVVKIPNYQPYFEIIKQLHDEKIRLNITLTFTVIQALAVAKLDVDYVSVFVGKWEDLDADTHLLLASVRDMLDCYDFKTELLAASIRTPIHLSQAIESGAHVATIPPHLLESSLKHQLTERGIEQFAQDWKKLGSPEFPK